MELDQKFSNTPEVFTEFSPREISIRNLTNTQNIEITSNTKVHRIGFFKIYRWDKLLIIMIFTMVMIILTLTIIFMNLSYHFNKQILEGHKPGKSDSPCLTFGCLHASVDLIKSIDSTMDPCIDFHRFACGKWEDEQIFPNGQSRYGKFNVANDELFKIQKKILENQIIVNQSSPWSNVFRFYNSCNNMEKIDALGASPLKNHLAKIYNKYGGWDMLNNPLIIPFDSWDFRNVIEDPDVFSSVFEVAVYEDEKNSKKFAIYINLVKLLLERRYFENVTISQNRQIFDAYLRYMNHVGRLLMIDPSKSFHFSEIMDLEIKIAVRHPKEEDQRDPDSTYNKVPVSKLQDDICPLFNWTNILRRRFQLVNITLPENTEVIISAPDSLKSICALLQSYTMNSQKKLILHNYMIWKFVANMVSYLSQDFQDAWAKFNKVYKGSVGNPQRWEMCIEMIQNRMGHVIGNMYVTQMYNKKSKSQVLKMINLMKKKFRKNLSQNKWMDAATKSEAIKKIDNMVPIIGYTDSSLNRSFIEDFYRGITLNNDKYYDNVRQLKRLDDLRMLQKLNKSVEKTIIEIPQEVNAFYSPIKNEVIFPAGILQSPFFDPDFPKSMNYGSIGSAMGHEITHGFDDTGSRYDSDGNLRQWWSNVTRSLFMDKSNCFIDQYSKYSFYGQSINGLNTLGENIADNGGLRLTYQVYKDIENEYGVEEPLPALKFTHDQLFFISYARNWCGIETKESTIFKIFANMHAPEKYRIIGVLSNMKEFSDAFNCPSGSPMNPHKKCIVW